MDVIDPRVASRHSDGLTNEFEQKERALNECFVVVGSFVVFRFFQFFVLFWRFLWFFTSDRFFVYYTRDSNANFFF